MTPYINSGLQPGFWPQQFKGPICFFIYTGKILITAIHQNLTCLFQILLKTRAETMRYSAVVFTIVAMMTGQVLAIICDCQINGVCYQFEDVNFSDCEEMCGNLYNGGGKPGRGRSVHIVLQCPLCSTDLTLRKDSMHEEYQGRVPWLTLRLWKSCIFSRVTTNTETQCVLLMRKQVFISEKV